MKSEDVLLDIKPWTSIHDSAVPEVYGGHKAIV